MKVSLNPQRCLYFFLYLHWEIKGFGKSHLLFFCKVQSGHLEIFIIIPALWFESIYYIPTLYLL